MMKYVFGRHGAALVAMATFVLACGGSEPPQADPEATPAPEAAATAHGPEVEAALATLRTLVQPYQSFDAAQAAGYTVQVPNCRENPPEGGMGWHYLNPAFVGPTVEVDRPQVVMYEPQQDGSMELVGVEYIIPFDIRPSTEPPPTLMGQEFVPNFSDNLWMLHVWVGRENHEGMFATWNPAVSCSYAQ